MDGYTLGPIIAAIVLAFAGTLLQMRLQNGSSGEEDEFSPMPYGGNGGSVQKSRSDGYEEYKRGFWN